MGAAADALLSFTGRDPEACDESAYAGAVLVAAFFLTQLPPENPKKR